MPLYVDGADIADDLQDLTKEEIISAGKPILFSKADGRTRAHLLETVSLLNVQDQLRIHAAAVQKRKSNYHGHRSKRQKIAGESEQATQEDTDGYAESDFLQAPDQATVESCIANFIDRTGNIGTATATCMVCARRVMASETRLLAVGAIPNKEILTPATPHPAHQLTGGMLLEIKAIVDTDGVKHGWLLLFFAFF